LNEKTGGGGTIVANPVGKLFNKGVDSEYIYYKKNRLVSKSHFVDDGFDDEGLSTTHNVHLSFLQMNHLSRK
jgi:hypothetical protein